MNLSMSAHPTGDRVRRDGEVWVREKGLPPVKHGRLVDQLRGRLLLATDLSDESHDANARGIQLAEDAGLPLLVLGIQPSAATSDRHSRRRLSTQLTALVRAARERGIDVEGRLVAGNPARAILSAASSWRTGTIIMGYDQWRESAATGSIVGHVLLHTTTPVLLVGARSYGR